VKTNIGITVVRGMISLMLKRKRKKSDKLQKINLKCICNDHPFFGLLSLENVLFKFEIQR